MTESYNGHDSIERSVHSVRQSPLFESLVIPEGL